MTTWAPSYSHSHLHHPWFAKPSMKRKLTNPPSPPSTSSSSSRRSSESASPPPSKRRRQTALETTFSSLSLQNSQARASSDKGSYVPPIPSFTGTVAPNYRDVSTPDVKMKTSTWYEPEPDRIVVTDLDSSSDDEPDNQTGSSLQVSPMVLRKLAAQSQKQYLSNNTPSQALVLYKPLPVAGIPSSVLDDNVNEEGHSDNGTLNSWRDEDAMDIEP